METTARSDKLMPPIDMSRVKNEKGVKEKIKQLLDKFGWFHWMPGANGYGAQGVHDHLALKDGVFISVEAKFGSNKPVPTQKAFARHVMTNDGFSFCVNEKNIDHLAWWLESFGTAVLAQMRSGGDEESVPPEHGARMLNAISVLTEPFA